MNKIKTLLGKRIKELREKRRLTQQQLAEAIGIDQRNLSKIECGITFPSKCLAELAKNLEIDLSQLFSLEHLNLNESDKKEALKDLIDSLSASQVELLYKITLAIFN